MKNLAPYLYETWYDGCEDCDFAGDDGPFGNLPAEGLGGCSSVRVGNFNGRNLDIGVSDCATDASRTSAMRSEFGIMQKQKGILIT